MIAAWLIERTSVFVSVRIKPDTTYVMIAALVIERASVFVVSGFSRTCINA